MRVRLRHTTATMVLLVLLLLLAAPAAAQVRSVIGFQGLLEGPTGALVDGSHDVTFRIYEVPEGGLVLWSETHQNLDVDAGLLYAQLGSIVSFASAGLEFDKTYYLGITVDSDPEMTPRIEFQPVPYALNSLRADLAKRALDADRADRATQADDADRADRATRANEADRADTATHADEADHALTADHADEADRADDAAHADDADHADLADRADVAGHADHATRADEADRADVATTAGHAATAGDADTLDGLDSTDFTRSDQSCPSGERVIAIDALGAVTCAPETNEDADLLDGLDSTAFARSDQACPGDEVVVAIEADGTVTCAADQSDADTLDGLDSIEFLTVAGDQTIQGNKTHERPIVSVVPAPEPPFIVSSDATVANLRAQHADHAGFASRAEEADHADRADHALVADDADQASRAERATEADIADDARRLGGFDADAYVRTEGSAHIEGPLRLGPGDELVIDPVTRSISAGPGPIRLESPTQAGSLFVLDLQADGGNVAGAMTIGGPDGLRLDGAEPSISSANPSRPLTFHGTIHGQDAVFAHLESLQSEVTGDATVGGRLTVGAPGAALALDPVARSISPGPGGVLSLEGIVQAQELTLGQLEVQSTDTTQDARVRGSLILGDEVSSFTLDPASGNLWGTPGKTLGVDVPVLVADLEATEFEATSAVHTNGQVTEELLVGDLSNGIRLRGSDRTIGASSPAGSIHVVGSTVIDDLQVAMLSTGPSAVLGEGSNVDGRFMVGGLEGIHFDPALHSIEVGHPGATLTIQPPTHVSQLSTDDLEVSGPTDFQNQVTMGGLSGIVFDPATRTISSGDPVAPLTLDGSIATSQLDVADLGADSAIVRDTLEVGDGDASDQLTVHGLTVLNGTLSTGQGLAVAVGSSMSLGNDGNVFLAVDGGGPLDVVYIDPKPPGTVVVLVVDGSADGMALIDCVPCGATENLHVSTSDPLGTNDVVVLVSVGGSWFEVSRSDNLP